MGDFRFGERVRLEFRAEAFNVINTPQFSNPQSSMTGTNFGFITSTGGSGTV